MTNAELGQFWLQLPMKWEHSIKARFDDDADYSNLPSKVQKREGTLYIPTSSMDKLEVLATHGGRVSYVGYYKPGYGHYVTITHKWGYDTFVSWYGHLDSVWVTSGQTIKAGDIIGIAGQSGNTDEVCLFFTLQHLGKGKKNYVVKDVVDPTPYFITDEEPEVDEAIFEADVTIDDGTVLVCGNTYKKTWKLRNAGTTTWGDGYQFVFFDDTPMGTVDQVPLPHTPPGETVQVSVDIIVPAESGIYRSTWKPRRPDGTFFPNEQWVEIDARKNKTSTQKPKLSFVDDITIPDGELMTPDEQFQKTWRVKNTGNVMWKGYTLRFSGGQQMGAPDIIPLPELRPQQEGNISINFTSPNEVGLHRSTWLPHDDNGNPFDFDIYVEVNVRSSGSLNTEALFDSPISGTWTKGAYRYLTPVPYGDGKHNGVDYVNCAGQNISAGGVGTVYKVFPCKPCAGKSFDELGLTDRQKQNAYSSINYVYGFGNLVIIRYAWEDLPTRARQTMSAHGFDGYYAFAYYAHLAEPIVARENQSVLSGSPIGFVGNTGNSTAFHLHLEVRCYKSATPPPLPSNVHPVLIDPEEMFKF